MTLALLTHAETAALFRKHPDSWRRLWPKWRDEKGFPPPVEGPPWLWDEAHITAWLDRKLEGAQRDAVARARGLAQGPAGRDGDNVLALHVDALNERFGT